MIRHQISVDQSNVTVLFEGDIDIDATEIIEEEFIPMLSQYQSVEIDFSKVQFVDSTGIGLIIKLVQSLKKKGIRVTITQINPDIFEVFSLLQIPDILGRDVFV